MHLKQFEAIQLNQKFKIFEMHEYNKNSIFGNSILSHLWSLGTQVPKIQVVILNKFLFYDFMSCHWIC